MIYSSIFASPGRCVPNNGECGSGLELPMLRCIKQDLTDNQRSSYEVILENCDKLEINQVNSTYKRPCEVSCEYYKWKPYESEVI